MKSHLNRLRPPHPKDDIELLLPKEQNRARTKRSGRPCFYRFETYDECIDTDRRRLRAARRVLADKPGLIDQKLAQTLANDLDYEADDMPPESRASALYMWALRPLLAGEILRWRRKYFPDMAGVHMLSHKWDVRPEDLTPRVLRKIIKELSNYLDKSEFRRATGFFIAGLDGEYNELRGIFRIHFHCVACGDYPNLIRNHLKFRAAFKPLCAGQGPIVFRDIRQPAAAVSYTVKAAWTYRGIKIDLFGTPSDGRKSYRMPEPYSTLYLSVLNDLTVGETVIVRGLSIQHKKFVIKHMR